MTFLKALLLFSAILAAGTLCSHACYHFRRFLVLDPSVLTPSSDPTSTPPATPPLPSPASSASSEKPSDEKPALDP